MALEDLHGYADASGQEETVTEKILTVNGCLSTPAKWSEFKDKWQAYLKSKGFKPHRKTGNYVFHTSSFWANAHELMPQNLSEDEKQEIYRHLIEIICKYTVYRFGYAVVLDDFYNIEAEFPFIRELWLKKPGTRMSFLCFRLNSMWAENNNYNPCISYTFDWGDRFFGELDSEYRRTIKKISEEDRAVVSLTSGDKAHFIPIQAADVIAWECRRYFYERLDNDEMNRLGFEKLPRPELRRLNVFGKSSLRLYTAEHLKEEILEAVNDSLSDEGREWLLGEGKPFKNIEEYARAVSKFNKDETVAETKARQEAAKLKRSKKP